MSIQKFLCLCILLGSYLNVACQTQIDSLIQVYRNEEVQTGERLSALYEVAFDYINNNTDSAMFWSDTLYYAADRLNEPTYKCNALNVKSYTYQNVGKYEEAIEACREGLSIAFGSGDSTQMAKFNYNLGSCYFTIGENEQANKFLRSAEEYFKKFGPEAYLNTCRLTMAMNFRQLSQNKKALELYTQCLQDAKNSGNWRNQFTALNSLGLIYFDLGDHEKAIELHLEALDIAGQMNDKRSMSFAFTNLGNEYMKLKKFEEANDAMLRSLELRKEVGDVPGIMESFYNLGNFQLERNHPQSAIDYFNQSLELAHVNDEPLNVVFSQVGLSIAYNKLNESKRAISWASKAYNRIDSTENKEWLERKFIASQQLYIAYKKEDKLDSAFYFLEMNTALGDSVATDINSDELVLAEREIARTQSELDQSKIAQKEAENLAEKRKVQLLIAGSSLLILALVGGFLYFKKVQYNNVKRFEFEKKIALYNASENRADEERARFARDLHDVVGSSLTLSLFNLQSIKKSITEESVLSSLLSTVNSIKSAMGEVRSICYDLMPRALEEGGLFRAITEFAENQIESVPFRIELDLPSNPSRLNKNSQIHVYKMVKELLTNTVKYAEAAEVSLVIQEDEQLFVLSYSDDGKGTSLDVALEKSKSKGQGLIGLLDRSEIIEGECEIKSELGNGFFFQLTKKL